MSHEIARILREAQQVPWAITEDKLAEIRYFLHARALGIETMSADEREAMIRAAEDRTRIQTNGSVAVLPVFGTIAQRMNMMMAMSGGTSTDILRKEINAAIADPDISSILLNVDSPGGTVSGLPELHATMLAARGKKPIVASINSFSASAAYWVTSAASEIAITPSGEAGSIGVYALHVDFSEFDKEMGVKYSLISAGKFKTEGNEFEPLSDEARAKIQEDVDAFYMMFVRDVAKGRGVSVAEVRDNYGQGRMLLAKDAVARGLADRVESFDDTAARLTRGGTRRGRSADDLKKRFELAGKFFN